MRSGIIAAAFAATAIAVPLQERAVVYDTAVEMVYVTDYVTVTANGASPTEEATSNNHHYGHGNHWWHSPEKQHTKEPEPAPEPSPTYVPPTTSTWEPAPTSEPPAQPTESSPSSAPAPSDYQGTVIYQHNIHRSNHSAPDIQWSSSLAATAQKIADSCSYAHNTAMDGGGYGQNIAAGVDGSGIDRVITDMFYDSEVTAFAGLYGEDHPAGFETWGHFSQMVWINTVQVACVTKHCPGGLANVGGNVPPYFTVCNYSPPGNVAGMYAKNVKAPKGDPPVVI